VSVRVTQYEPETRITQTEFETIVRLNPIDMSGGSPSPAASVTFIAVRDALALATSNVGLNNFRLEDLGDPVHPQDAVTLSYFNTHSGGGGGGSTGVRRNVPDGQLLSPTQSGNTYTNDAASEPVEITLPASADIDAQTSGSDEKQWRARFVCFQPNTFRIKCAGLDEFLYNGIGGVSLESATPGDWLDVEYVGVGVFLVTGSGGDGWSFPT